MTMISETTGDGTPQHPTRVCLSGSAVDLMDQPEAVAAVVAACRAHGAAPLAVVSANLDHVHHFGTGGRWHGVIEHSEATGRMRWLSLLDGAPLVSQSERLPMMIPTSAILAPLSGPGRVGQSFVFA